MRSSQNANLAMTVLLFLQLEFQLDLLELCFELLILFDQPSDRIACGVELAMQHLERLAIFTSGANQGSQGRSAQMWAVANLRATMLVIWIKAEFHRHPSLNADNLAILL